jgi:hypothetical protein
MKYALRKMLMRNAITASKNANCVDFTGCSNNVTLFQFFTQESIRQKSVENRLKRTKRVVQTAVRKMK